MGAWTSVFGRADSWISLWQNIYYRKAGSHQKKRKRKMKYQDQALNLTVDQRKTLNAKALYLVSSKKAASSEITPEEIYNA